MPTPTYTTPINEYVIIEIISGEVSSSTVSAGYGQVKLVSDIVTEVSVGQNVFFRNAVFYTVTEGAFAVVNQSDIMFIKLPAP